MHFFAKNKKRGQKKTYVKTVQKRQKEWYFLYYIQAGQKFFFKKKNFCSVFLEKPVDKTQFFSVTKKMLVSILVHFCKKIKK